MSSVTLTVISLLWLCVVNKAVHHSCLVQTLVYSETPTEFYLLLFIFRKKNMPWREPGTNGDILTHSHHLAELYLEVCCQPPGAQHNPNSEWDRQCTSSLQALCCPPLKSTDLLFTVSWNWLVLCIFFTKINNRSTGPPFPGLQEGSPNTGTCTKQRPLKPPRTPPQEALGDVAASCTDALSQDHLHSGCIKQLDFSPAQLLQHVSHQDYALQLDSATCVYFHDPINKNLFMKIWAVI